MRFFRVGVWSILATLAAIGTLTAFSLWSTPKAERATAHTLAAADTIELVIGDTLHYLRSLRRPVSNMRLVSSNASIVSVTTSGALIARAPGMASIASITVPGTQSGEPLIFVKVTTKEQATNAFVTGVCANVDSLYFLDSLPLTTNLPRIHEYHDCQRLIQNTTYSAVIGIFASENVETYQNAAEYVDGRLAAVIVNFVGTKNLTYDPLGLKPGVNCLVIRSVRDPASTRARTFYGWEAAVVPQATPARDQSGNVHYGDCPDTLAWRHVPIAEQGKLTVVTQRGFDLMNRRIAPPVARWDWDSAKRINYMGVKCTVSMWCEIGPHGFMPSPALRTPAGNPIFKGYYDQQYLADTTGAHPSTVFGTIRPGRDGRDKTQMQAHDPTVWYQTTRLELREDGPTSPAYQHYKQVFHASALPLFPLTATSDLQLRPKNPEYLSGYVGKMSSVLLADTAIHFTPHLGYSGLVLPTVRWRWKVKDEGAWTYCHPQGCCEYLFAGM